jgi:hypothetical protein
MAGFPDYRESVQLSDQPAGVIRPQPTIDVPGGVQLANPVASSGLGDAMAGFGGEILKDTAAVGKEMVALQSKIDEGTQNTKASEAMGDFLQKRDTITQKWLKSSDYAGAEAGFNDEITQAKMEALGRIDSPVLRAKADLEMTRSAITSRGQVRDNAFGQQADINVASLDQFKQGSLNDAINAKSDAERIAAIDRYGKETQRIADAGWISQREVVKRGAAFGQELQQADVMKLVQADPVRAKALLGDARNFPALDPVQRQSFISAATDRADSNLTGELQQRANFDPVGAALTLGRVHDQAGASQVFQAIKKVENASGDNSVVSDKGAIGITQILPSTARDVATSLGMADVAKLSDGDLATRLKSDPALNDRLGGAYWQQLVGRYNGNVAAAAAAYNGGPGRADKWVQAASAKFGDAFTPAQLASVIDIKETRDYVGKVYGALGARMDAGFSSPAALVRATNAVGATMAADLGREKQIVASIASTARATSQVGDLLQQGYDVAPAAIASYRATQQAAADKGDMEAAKALRDLDYGLKVQPIIRAAWTQPPALLDGAVQNMQARMTAPGYAPTQDEARLFKALDAVRSEQIKVRDTEPVALGGANGGRFYQVNPIDARAALDDNLTQALRDRDSQAVMAHRVYGGSGSPFLKEEAASWSQRYQDAAPQEQTAILGALAKGLSPQSFAAALPQVTGKTDTKADRPALTVAAGIFNDVPEVAQSVIAGMNAKEADKRVVPQGAAEKTYQTTRDQYLPQDAFARSLTTDPNGPFKAMQGAIEARYADLSSRAKDVSGALNASRLKQAVDDVTGGVVYHNGAPLIAPSRGLTQGQFDGVLAGVSDADMAGVQTTGGKPITADYLRSSAKLRSLGDGKYLVQVNQNDEAPQYASVHAGSPAPAASAGLRVPGNIDLANRPIVRNADGTISTVRSASFGTDDGEVLLPTVSGSGKILSNFEALAEYKATGKHLGIFDTPASATKYAEALHNAQAGYYSSARPFVLNLAGRKPATTVVDPIFTLGTSVLQP